MSAAMWLTTVVAVIYGFSLAAAILILGVICATAIGGKRGRLWRNDDLVISERDRAA